MLSGDQLNCVARRGFAGFSGRGRYRGLGGLRYRGRGAARAGGVMRVLARVRIDRGRCDRGWGGGRWAVVDDHRRGCRRSWGHDDRLGWSRGGRGRGTARQVVQLALDVIEAAVVRGGRGRGLDNHRGVDDRRRLDFDRLRAVERVVRSASPHCDGVVAKE